jgi:predicted AAA+ superfamily ATPase
MKISANIYIPRKIESILKEYVKTFPAIAITGPRQTGKSTLIKNIFKKTHTIVSFDDPLIRERALSDPKLFIENTGEKIVFDEIQYAPQILSYIKILIDSNRHKYGRYIITGSQQFSLIKNLGDTLAGRIALLDLLPFETEEKKQINSLRKKLSNPLECFIHSCLQGSFPEIVIHSNLNPEAWYGGYIQTYLERDIRTIYNIGILREFQQFLHLLAARCSQILNLSNFSKDLGVSVNTIKKWLSILEASRIIYILPPYYLNLGKRISKNPKIYFLDIGLVCYLTGITNKEHLLNGPLGGPLFENFIIQETVKHFFNKGIRPNLFYLRTHNGIEIDLLIESNLRLFPIEIKLTKSPNIGMGNSIERFKKIFNSLKIDEGKIISLSTDEMKITKNISIINLDSYWKYLNDLLPNMQK